MLRYKNVRIQTVTLRICYALVSTTFNEYKKKDFATLLCKINQLAHTNLEAQ